MRSYYLRSTQSTDSGCRGGVGDSYGDDYALEIGHRCNADVELMATVILHDEIMEFLTLCNSPLANLVLSKHKDLQESLIKQQIDKDV